MRQKKATPNRSVEGMKRFALDDVAVETMLASMLDEIASANPVEIQSDFMLSPRLGSI